MPSSSKRNKERRSLAGQVDYIALSRDLVDAVESGVYIVQSRRFVYINPFFSKLTGYSREELIGTMSSKLVLPQDRPAVKKKAIRNLKSRVGSKPYEYRFIKKNGEVIWVMERVSPIEYMGKQAALGNFVDITERKRLEGALAHSEETYRTILEQMYDAYYEVDLAGNFSFVNDAVCRNLGYSSEEMVGQSYRLFTPPDDIKPLLLAFNEVYKTGIPNIGFPHGILRKDGSIISVESSISLRENEQGEIIGFRSVSRDITERRKMVEAVVNSEERYRTILEQLQDSYYEVDLAGNFTFVNESTGYSFGYSRDELIGQNYRLVIPEEDVEGQFAAYNEVFRTGKPNRGFPHKIRRKDGRILFSEVAIDLHRDEMGNVVGFKSVSRDITQRMQMEEELQKLASIVRYSSELVNLSTLDGNMVFLNDAGIRMLGVDPQKIDQFNIMQVIPDHLKEKVQSELLPALLKGGTWEGDLQYLNLKTRQLTDVHAVTFAIKDRATGAPLHFANVSLDITERKKAENALRESEERANASMENAPDGIYMNDLQGNFLYGNRRCEEIIGFKREELIGKNFLELNILPEKSLARAAEILQDNINGKSTGPDELELISKDGRRVPIEINTSVLQRGGEKVVLSFVRDITERKSVENALRESEAQYRLLAEHMTNTVGLVDMDLNNIYESPSAEKITGFTHDELMELPMEKRLTPESLKLAAEVFLEVIPRVMADPDYNPVITLELEICRKDGTTLQMENVFSIIRDENGKPISILRESKDITERKQAEAMLRDSEEKYRSLFDNAMEGIFVAQSDKIVFLNAQLLKMTGYSYGEIMEKPFIEFVHPDDREMVIDRYTSWLKGEAVSLSYDFRGIKKNGDSTWVLFRGVLITWKGRPATLNFMGDLTDRKLAEEALRESEGKYRSLVENINDVFYILDTQGNITYISTVVERFTAYKVSELIGKPFIPLIYPDDLPPLLDSFNRLVSGQLEPWEFRVIDKDGRIIFVRTSSRPIYEDGKIVGITALMTDITERKQLEQKLVEMATHDFLTGLPNRVLLLDRFTIAAALAHRNKARLAVMSLDLDKFKSINDTLGHDAGDQVLKMIGVQLTGIIRASDTLARVGGDEFILVMMEAGQLEDATAIAQKILDSFKEPLWIDGHHVNLSTSIGIAIYPEDAQDLETLIKKSDAAMYYSKGHGRNQFKFFSDGDVRIGGDHRSAT
jgi:diguanylate cyclase (GGDEF)-like protein/PAS domain S-box-containing protein